MVVDGRIGGARVPGAVEALLTVTVEPDVASPSGWTRIVLKVVFDAA